MRRQAAPADGAGQAKLIERVGIVVGDAARQNVALPGVGGNFETLQLAQNFKRAAFAAELRSGRDVLPAQQPAHELRGRDRLDLLAQRGDREAMDAGEQAALAPFDSFRRAVWGSSEISAQDEPLASRRSSAFSISAGAGRPWSAMRVPWSGRSAHPASDQRTEARHRESAVRVPGLLGTELRRSWPIGKSSREAVSRSFGWLTQ